MTIGGGPRGAAIALLAAAALVMLVIGAYATDVLAVTTLQADGMAMTVSGTLDVEHFVELGGRRGEQALAAGLRERLLPGYSPEELVALPTAEGFRCSEVNRTGIRYSCSYGVQRAGPLVKSVVILVKVRRGPPPDFSTEFVPLRF